MTGAHDPELVDIDVPNSLDMPKHRPLAHASLDVPHLDRVVQAGTNDPRLLIARPVEVRQRTDVRLRYRNRSCALPGRRDVVRGERVGGVEVRERVGARRGGRVEEAFVGVPIDDLVTVLLLDIGGIRGGGGVGGRGGVESGGREGGVVV
mgnify:CR=1 FL=1